MKTVSIGDTHGLAVVDTISKIIDKYDKFIFVGDYVDSFTVDDSTITRNLLDLIELKEMYPEKIILLWGNHDIQYLLGYEQHGCSGYRPEMNDSLYDIFSKNKELFQFSYQIKDYIWTHAGIHNSWYQGRFKISVVENITISDQLNTAFEEKNATLFDVGHMRGGRYQVGGPLWCDISELTCQPLKGFNQIVGHNRVKYTERINKHNKEIVFIDRLENEKAITTSSFYYKDFIKNDNN